MRSLVINIDNKYFMLGSFPRHETMLFVIIRIRHVKEIAVKKKVYCGSKFHKKHEDKALSRGLLA